MNKTEKIYVELQDLVEEIIDNRGKTVPTSDLGIPLIATNCIKHSSIYPTFENVRFISEETHRTWFRAHLKPNDILFVNKGTPGRVCVVPNPINFCAAQDMVGLRFKNTVDYRYMLAILRSNEIQKTIANNHVGLVIPHYRKQELVGLKLPIISFEIQKRIGKIYFDLSNKIELNNKINAELEAMAKTLYDYWFVQFDFPDANGKPYKSSGGKMVYNEILKREIPGGGWEVKSLEYISDIVGGSTPSKQVDEHFTQTEGTAWITPKDLSLNTGNKYIDKGEFNVTDLGLKNASLKIMPKGTVLMSSRAPIGYMAISSNNVTTNQGFKSFVPKNGFPSEFIYYLIQNLLPQIVNNASGSTFKEVSGSVLKSLNVCIPGKKLIEEYQVKVASIFKNQEIIEIENQELSTLRDWLLPMLMNGQVSVVKGYEQVEEVLSVAAEANSEYIKNLK